MRAVAGAAASDGLRQDVLGLLCGAGMTTGINIRKVLPQVLCQLMLLLIGEGRRLDGAHADRLIVQDAASEEAFDRHFLFVG